MTTPNGDVFDLIVGSSGQDGFYLQKLLQKQGKKILCINRDGLFDEDDKLQPFDICKADIVDSLFKQYPIRKVFYLAAYHHSAEQQDANHITTLKMSMDIHVYALDNFINAMKKYRPEAKIFYAASSHLFSGHTSNNGREVLIDENTPLSPIGWYALSKAAGVELIKAARDAGLYAVAGFMFNHESARRSKSFLSSKLTNGALDALNGQTNKLELLDIKTQVDWGYAPDYVKAMQLCLGHSTAQDYVIATGNLRSIEDYAEQVYGLLDLDWREFITVNSDATKKIGGATAITGNSTLLMNSTGWKPEMSFENMVARILHDTAKERNIQLTKN